MKMTDFATFEAMLADHDAVISAMSVDRYAAYCTNVARLVNEGTEHGFSGDALRAYVNTRLKG
jgi:hypothetical protein